MFKCFKNENRLVFDFIKRNFTSNCNKSNQLINNQYFKTRLQFIKTSTNFKFHNSLNCLINSTNLQNRNFIISRSYSTIDYKVNFKIYFN